MGNCAMGAILVSLSPACMHAGTKKQNAQKALVTESDGRRSVTDRSPLETQSYIDKLLQFHNFYEFLSF
jgi:hypothetical protein